MQEEHILKERVKLLIGDATVKAALFYTFNFDPKFFENYIMPLLVPGQQFVNNAITNNILWRRLYKEATVVPPITVFYDLYAKSPEHAPMLPYQSTGVNMASLGKNKGNFHPKHSFILIEKDSGEEALIVLTGSNNLTQGGWCENMECVSEHTLINGKSLPYFFKKELKAFIEDVSAISSKDFTNAEQQVYSFLNSKKTTTEKNFIYYSSFKSSFPAFLEANVLTDTTVNEVEIVSPYFLRNTKHIEYLTSKGLKVKVMAPFQMGYCLLEKDVYEAYENAGAKWHKGWEDRKVHSKVYRFYGSEITYTFIGSVNFTAPAWCGVPEKKTETREIYNIESGILYWEKEEKKVSLLGTPLNKHQLQFFPVVDDPLENGFERINAPTIEFTINWKTKSLLWKGKMPNPCVLQLMEGVQVRLNDSRDLQLLSLPHGSHIVEALARQSILQVAEQAGDKELVHLYYANQLHYEQKPIEFRMSATDILDAWDLLGENTEGALNDYLVSRLELLADLAQDESGKLVQERSQNKSLLNEMARHLHGLVKLEAYLFDEAIMKKAQYQQAAHANNLKYYLTHDNVDTLHSYIRDIDKLYSENRILGGYYWLLVSILHSKFYNHPRLPKLIKGLENETEQKEVKAMVEARRIELEEKIELAEKHTTLEKKKIKWAKETLTL